MPNNILIPYGRQCIDASDIETEIDELRTEWRVPGACSFVPNWFVDISRTIESNVMALREYELEMRSWPSPRSIRNVENLACVRGASIGEGAAEAFVLGRLIQADKANIP